ncbi:MAG TPA: protoporphyrinogen oxidase [Polyangiaceae bacterium]|nr:protoporphyrinogen oxidase [Polyangiaceae bacterium]
MTTPIDVAVLGGGISGLTAAFTLGVRRPELDVRVLEAGPRLGGCIRTDRTDGFVIEAGPDSFLRTKPEALELCRELGLEGELIGTRPEAHTVFLARAGRLERMPAGMVLAAPTRLWPLLRTPLLSLGGKLRAACDLVLPSGSPGDDESIASFLSRRFGREVAERIGGPLLGSIHAADIGELSLAATFPQLAELEKRWGSVILGLLALEAQRRARTSSRSRRFLKLRALLGWLLRRRSEPRESPFLSLRGGMEGLVERLVARLPEERVRINEPVVALERDGDRWLVRTASGTLSARAVIATVPAPVAARLVPNGGLSHELGTIRYGSTAAVALGFERSAEARPLGGSGFLSMPGESPVLAATWVTSKWEGRAPDRHVLVRAYFGGPGSAAVLAESDGELVETARRELERFMGALGTPLLARVYRHQGNRPQPTVGHRERLARVGTELASLPGLFLAGAGYEGSGIPDCVRQGRAAAERVSALLSRQG